MAYQAASLEAELGRRDDALARLDAVCRTPAPLPAALALQGRLLVESGDCRGAREAMTKGIALYGDAVDLHYLLAQAWLVDPASSKDGEPEAQARDFAVSELRAVLRVMKDHPPALNNLAWLLSRDEATRAEALQCAEAAVGLRPSAAAYVDTLGTVLMRLGRTDQAVAAFRRALGACEAEKGAIERRAAKKQSTIEASRLESLKTRLAHVKDEATRHYDEALRTSSGR
jgi:tetratricopeptide (TPR) repeat protein